MAFSSVDFPAPFGPTSATCAPVGTRRLTSRSASRPGSFGYEAETPIASSATSDDVASSRQVGHVAYGNRGSATSCTVRMIPGLGSPGALSGGDLLLTARESFRRDLQDLHDQVLVLGSMADKAIEKSVDSIARLDFPLAQQVIDEDKLVNRKRFEIEEQAIRLIAMQQPMASDLRAIVAVLYIIVDLERIADYAVGNARITLRHQDRELLKPLIDIPRMTTVARDMLHEALDAFVVRDADRARALAKRDDEVDGLYEQIYRELLTYMLNDPQTIDRATWLLWVAHNIERTADRVTNVCERIVYEATGRMEEIGASQF